MRNHLVVKTLSFLGLAAAAMLSGCIIAAPPAGSNTPAESEPAPEAEPSGGQSAEVPPGLREHPPVQCLGNEDVYLESVFISTPDSGVEVVGNCTVNIVGSHITAGTYGISITGNGTVHIQDSLVEGRAGSVHIVGNGDLETAGSRFVGVRSVTGNGEIIDGGGNLWQ